MTSETATERVTAVLSSRRLHESGVLLTASAEGSTYQDTAAKRRCRWLHESGD